MKITYLWYKTVYAFFVKSISTRKLIYIFNLIILYVTRQDWYSILAFPALNSAYVEINVFWKGDIAQMSFSSKASKL